MDARRLADSSRVPRGPRRDLPSGRGSLPRRGLWTAGPHRRGRELWRGRRTAASLSPTRSRRSAASARNSAPVECANQSARCCFGLGQRRQGRGSVASLRRQACLVPGHVSGGSLVPGEIDQAASFGKRRVGLGEAPAVDQDLSAKGEDNGAVTAATGQSAKQLVDRLHGEVVLPARKVDAVDERDHHLRRPARPDRGPGRGPGPGSAASRPRAASRRRRAALRLGPARRGRGPWSQAPPPSIRRAPPREQRLGLGGSLVANEVEPELRIDLAPHRAGGRPRRSSGPVRSLRRGTRTCAAGWQARA